MSELKQVFQAADGTIFNSKAEADDYIRRPKILEAMMKITSNNEELSNWLMDSQELVSDAFDVGTIKRVTKSERKQLDKALEAIKESGDNAFKFVIDNAGAIADSFRWPTVKRLKDDEKATVIKTTLMGATSDNEELSEWIIANKDAILEAYQAGKEKRKVSPKAQEGLATYRCKKAIEKYATDNECSAEEAAASDEIKEKHSPEAIAAAMTPEAPEAPVAAEG